MLSVVTKARLIQLAKATEGSIDSHNQPPKPFSSTKGIDVLRKVTCTRVGDSSISTQLWPRKKCDP